MKLALAAMIEAIFTVMGAPETELRQCPLAMNKWEELIVSHKQTMSSVLTVVVESASDAKAQPELE